MVTTRSSTATKQSHLEDLPARKDADQAENKADSPQRDDKQRKANVSAAALKRRSSLSTSTAVKKQRTESTNESSVHHEDEHKHDVSKKNVAKSKRSGQAKLDTDNVSGGVASPAATTTKKKEKNKNKKDTSAHEPAAAPQPDKDKDKEDAGKDDDSDDDDDDVILINRSPVLTLWAACVTHFLHPNLSWETCLSAGSAVASLCAVSKGRSIGVYETPDDKDQKARERKQKQKQEEDEEDEVQEIEVLGFRLRVKDGKVVVGKDRKPGNEALLKVKFGEEGYAKVRKTFEEGLQTWEDAKEELNGRPFKMYESFRPDVASGQKGWGRKGSLSLGKVRKTIQRE